MDGAQLTGIEKASILILSLDDEKSLEVLQQLTTEERVTLGAQILSLRQIDPEAWENVLQEGGRLVNALAQTMEAATSAPARTSAFRGALAAVRQSVAAAFPHGIGHPDRRARDVHSPEDIARLSNAEIRQVLSEAGLDDVALALKVASDEMKSALSRNLSPAELDDIERRIEASGRPRVSEVEAAGERVAEAARRVTGGGS